MDTAAELEPDAEDGRESAPNPVHELSLWPPPRATRHSEKRRRRISVVSGVVLGVLLLGGGIAVAWTLVVGEEPEVTEGEAPASEFVGSWAGEMMQVDTEGEHVADWHAQVRIEEGAERGSTAWTTFSCSGTLELSARDGGRLVYAYTETADPEERCVDDAELTLWPETDARGLVAEWSSITREGTRMISTGALN